MRGRHKKTVIKLLLVHVLLVWCYLALRPAEVDRQIQLQASDSVRKPQLQPSDDVRYSPETRGNHDEYHEENESTEEVVKNITHNLELERSETCPELKVMKDLVRHSSWTAVSETKLQFVFSAYRENTHGPVKVIGANVHKKHSVAVYCQHWSASLDSRTVHVQQANIELLPENHGNRYSGAIFICEEPPAGAVYVSLVSNKCDIPLRLLTIQNATTPKSYMRKFTVCLKPLHFQYGRAYEMVEWIELNKILGAEKFIVYNYSIAENVGAVLNHYVKQGIVEVIQWNLPITSYTFPRTKPVDIHSIGMLPMLQDCLYRNKKHSEFIVNIDVDEFIIPRSKNITNWSEMMSQINIFADTYLFQNTFFRKEWTNANITFPGNHLAEKFNIVTLQKFQKENKIFPAGTRSKYFTRTKHAFYLMIHSVTRSKSITVPFRIGLLQHYRNWLNYKDTQPRITDDIVLRKYGKRLLNGVETVWNQLPNVQLHIPLPEAANENEQ